MVKLAALVAVLCGACVEAESTANQPITPYAADYFLILDGIKGESQDNKHGSGIYLWQYLSSTEALAAVVSDCVGSACHLEFVSASLQSGGPTADGPTSTWHEDGATLMSGNVVSRGTPDDDMFAIKISTGRWETVALRSLLDCVDPQDCYPVKGTFCVPICTLR